MEICLRASYTKGIGTEHSGLHKSHKSFVSEGEVAASTGLYNCRSPLPTVDLALLAAPVALFLPQLRSPALAGSVQGISPSVLGVPLYRHRWRFRHPTCQTPRLGLSLAVTSCSSQRAFICMYHVFEQNSGCFAKGGECDKQLEGLSSLSAFLLWLLSHDLPVNKQHLNTVSNHASSTHICLYK